MIYVKVRSVIHKTFEFYGSIHNALMKPTRVQTKLFQNTSLLMCYCSIVIGQFQILKTQSERHAIELLLKVQISSDQPTSNTNERGTFTSIPIFGKFTMLSMEFPIPNNFFVCHFSSKPMGIFIR